MCRWDTYRMAFVIFSVCVASWHLSSLLLNWNWSLDSHLRSNTFQELSFLFSCEGHLSTNYCDLMNITRLVIKNAEREKASRWHHHHHWFMSSMAAPDYWKMCPKIWLEGIQFNQSNAFSLSLVQWEVRYLLSFNFTTRFTKKMSSRIF